MDVLQKRIRKLEMAEKIDAALEEYYSERGLPVPEWKQRKDPQWWKASPFRNLPIVPGGGVTFGDFTVRFIVDEDLKNYYSIHSWMRDNGNADQMARTTGADDIYTGGQLHIVTSQYNPAFVVEFRDLFPVSLSNLQFDATISDVEYLTAEVTFKHQQFFIRDKNLRPL